MPRLSYAIVGIFVMFATLFIFIPDVSKPQYLTIKHWTGSSQTHFTPVAWDSQGQSRLALTLQGNEKRYQTAIEDRYALMKSISEAHRGDALERLPAFAQPHTSFYTLWDFFVPAFSCPFPVYRVGTLGDGGKYVCGLERALNKDNCVVYSMGVEQQSSFEESILTQFPHCEVFGFDYTVDHWGPQLLGNLSLLHRAHFNRYKITGIDDHNANPKEYSMQGIMRENGHQFVDILKMDIEGSEFTTLAALIESFNGEPLPFGQLQLEIHYGWSGWSTVGEFDKWWTILENAGLRAFWTEPNLMHVNNWRSTPDVSEWSFMNIRGMHALVDDSLPEYP